MAKRLNKNLVGGLTALAFIAITAAGVFMVWSLREVDPAIYVKQAQNLAQEGSYDRAATYYFRAYRVSKNAAYLVDVGKMYEQDGDENRAIGMWMEAVNQDPNLVEAHERLLEIFLLMGSPRQIKETAEQILRLEEKNPKALHALGIALIRLAGQPEGDRDKGFANLEQAHALAPEVYSYAESLAQFYWADAFNLAANDPEQARKRVTDALTMVKDLVAKNSSPGEDASKARVLYANLLASVFPPQLEPVLLTVPRQHLGGADRFAEAEKLYQQAVGLAGEDPELKSDAMASLAQYWWRRSATETEAEAKKALLEKSTTLVRQAIDVWPDGFRAYMLLAQIYANQGESLKSGDVCVERTNLPIDRKSLKYAGQKRDRISLLLYAAEQYLAAGGPPTTTPSTQTHDELTHKAKQLVEDAQAEVADPERHGPSLHIMGKVQLAQGKDFEAMASFEKADKADGTPVWQNKRYLGMLAFEHKQLGAARAALIAATQYPQADAATWFTLARVYMANDEPENAILASDEALKRNPTLPDAVKLKIAANQRLGRADRVSQFLAELDQQGGAADTIFKSRLLYQQEKYQEAYDLLKNAVEKEPAAEQVLRQMGIIAGKIGKQREVLALVEKAIQAAPDNFNLRIMALRINPDLTEEQRKEKLLGLIQQTSDKYLRAYRLGEYYDANKQWREAMTQFGEAAQVLMLPKEKQTPEAQQVGPRALLVILERQLLTALDQQWWDEAEAVVQTAIAQNVDGAHGMTFKGRAALVRQQYEAAMEAFKLALDEQPSQSEAWAWLGECHFRLQRQNEARTAYTRAADLNPNNAMAQRRLAQLAKSMGDLTEYGKRLDRCVQLSPDDPWVQQEELARQEERDPQEGIKRRETMREQDPNDLNNLLQLAHLYQMVGNLEKTTEHYTAALQHPEAKPGVAWLAAQFYAQIADRTRAFQVLAQADERAKTNQDKADILRMMAALYHQFGDLPAAEQHLRKAVDLDPGESTYVALGKYYIGNRQYKEAIEWLEKGIKVADQAGSPEAATIRRLRFDVLLRANDKTAATAAAKEYKERYPKDSVGYLFDADLYSMLGELNETISSLTRYLQDNPDAPQVLYRRAQHYATVQQWSAAIADLEHLRAVNPEALDYAPRLLLSQAYDLTDRADLALSELKALYEAHPEHETISQQYFQYYMDHQLFGDAEKLATALVNRAPDNPRWYFALGQACAALKDNVKTLASLRAAAEKSGFDWRYCGELLKTYAEFKNYDAGLRFYQETLPPDKRLSPVIYRYANLLVKAGRIDEALNAYRQALVSEAAYRDEVFVRDVASNAAVALGTEEALKLFRAEPADENLKRPHQHILAMLLANLDHRPEAMTVLDALLSTSTDGPEKASLYTRKGIIAEMDKNYALAAQFYEEGVKAHPDKHVLLNNLAFLLADKVKKPAEAIPYAEKAVQLNPTADTIDTLAWALVETGEHGRAIGLLTQALQRDLGSVPVLAHLGEAYRRAGNFEAAVPQLEQALKRIEQNQRPDDAPYRELAETSLKKAREKNTTP